MATTNGVRCFSLCLSETDADIAHTAAHGPTGLPGAVLYPRSTEDVVQIVKTASKHGIPLIPYCAGTSLEGGFNRTCLPALAEHPSRRPHHRAWLPKQPL